MRIKFQKSKFFLTAAQTAIAVATAMLVISAIVFAQGGWDDPSENPPLGNRPAPLNIGNINQVKDAGLGLKSLVVDFYGNIFGGLTVGSEEQPKSMLDIYGSARIGKNISQDAPPNGLRVQGPVYIGENAVASGGNQDELLHVRGNSDSVSEVIFRPQGVYPADLRVGINWQDPDYSLQIGLGDNWGNNDWTAAIDQLKASGVKTKRGIGLLKGYQVPPATLRGAFFTEYDDEKRRGSVVIRAWGNKSSEGLGGTPDEKEGREKYPIDLMTQAPNDRGHLWLSGFYGNVNIGYAPLLPGPTVNTGAKLKVLDDDGLLDGDTNDNIAEFVEAGNKRGIGIGVFPPLQAGLITTAGNWANVSNIVIAPAGSGKVGIKTPAGTNLIADLQVGGTVKIDSLPANPAGKVVCVKADGILGTCSSVINSNGTCDCD